MGVKASARRGGSSLNPPLTRGRGTELLLDNRRGLAFMAATKFYYILTVF